MLKLVSGIMNIEFINFRRPGRQRKSA